MFSVDDLGLVFKGPDEKRLDIDLEEYFNLDWHQELKRILLAIQPFRFKDDFKRLINNSFLISTPIPSFICDCPFIEAIVDSKEIFEDFVFPITKDLTLVYSTRIDRNEIQKFLLEGNRTNIELFMRDFSTSRDLSLLALAERNVACSDMEYLKHLVITYKDFEARRTGTQFHLTVFSILWQYKEYQKEKR